MAVSPTPPPITLLPSPPLPTDPEAVFDTKAGISLTAQAAMVPEVNTALTWVAGALVDTKGYMDAAATSAGNAADSATLAGQQVAPAVTARQGAEAALASSVVIAAAVQAAAGTPSLAGNKNKVLTVNTDELGVSWKNAGQKIGDILYTANPVTTEYKLADGATYLQSSFPAWVSTVGATPISPPSAVQTFAPITLPARVVSTQVSWGANGTYIALGGNGSGGFGPVLELYKRSSSTFTKLANIPTTATSSAIGKGLVLSGDAVYAMAVNSAAPLLEFFKRTSDTFAKLADPTTLPADVKSISNNATCSADGVYWAFAGSGLSYYVYKRVGDVFTRIISATLPAGAGINGLSFSPDSNYLGFALNGTPFVSILKRTGDTFAAVATPITPPTAPQGACSFSADSTYFVSSGNAANYALTVFKRAADVFTRTQQFFDPAANSEITNCTLSGDGVYIGYGTGNGALMWRRTAEVWAQITNFVGNGLPGPVSVAFANGSTYFNNYFATIGNASPFLGLWRDAYPFDPLSEFQVPFVTTAANGVTAGNTTTNTKPPQVAAYVKVKEPA